MSTLVNPRGDKVYIDPSQNDYGDRIAAPYCPRAYHMPTVSTPLDWKEIKHGLEPYQFDIYTIGRRLEKKGDLWANILDKKTMNSNGKVLLALL